MSLVQFERSGGEVTITLDHPPVNILNNEVMREITESLRRLEPGDHVLVLRGNGKHFSAGADVKEHLPGNGETMLHSLKDLFERLRDVPIPTVAIVRGACMGAGLELAAACDIVFASEKAKLGVPEVTLGVIPPLAAVDLPARVGPQRAADLIFSGRTLSGAEAEACGLVLEAVPDEELDERARSWIGRLSGLSSSALRACKEALRSRSYGDALQVYRDSVLHSKDGIEGLTAFLEKRAPVWSNSPEA